jgi:hypothetical protein
MFYLYIPFHLFTEIENRIDHFAIRGIVFKAEETLFPLFECAFKNIWNDYDYPIGYLILA